MGWELRQYQQEAISAVEEWFATGEVGGALVSISTGAGKSLIAAELVKRTCARGDRALVLAGRKELIEQNHGELLSLWPEAPAGIYSAGLGRKDRHQQVIFAGVQSVYKKAESIGPFDLLIVDEAHCHPPSGDGMYQTLTKALQLQNPKLQIVGLSATCYRTTTGMLTDDGGIFKKIVYEAKLRDLIDQGFLSPLVNKSSTVHADLSNVHIRAGEFIQSEMEAAFDWDITKTAIAEIIKLGQDRKSWLVFCAGVKHAEKVAKEFRARGIEAECISGNTEMLFRDQHIRDFKSGKLRCITNCDVLTVGFNSKAIDLIAILRATASPGLLVQMIGRGLRTIEGKKNCLVLDYAENLIRHGPIDCIAPRKKGGSFDRTERLAKICPSCRETVGLAIIECPECGYVFVQDSIAHESTASTAPILNEPVTYEVLNVSYRAWNKPGKATSLRVDYFLGNLKTVSEWVCLEHGGFAASKAHHWWRKRAGINSRPPTTVAEALSRQAELPLPKTITVIQEGKFPRVVSAELRPVGELSESERAKVEIFEETGINI